MDTRLSFLIYTVFIGCFGLLSCGMTYFFDFHDPRSNPHHSDIMESIENDNKNKHRKPNINYSVTTLDS